MIQMLIRKKNAGPECRRNIKINWKTKWMARALAALFRFHKYNFCDQARFFHSAFAGTADVPFVSGFYAQCVGHPSPFIHFNLLSRFSHFGIFIRPSWMSERKQRDAQDCISGIRGRGKYPDLDFDSRNAMQTIQTTTKLEYKCKNSAFQ